MSFQPTVIRASFDVVLVFDELPCFGKDGLPRASLSLNYQKVSLAAELTPIEAAELGAALVRWGTAAYPAPGEEEENASMRRRPRFELADDEGNEENDEGKDEEDARST